MSKSSDVCPVGVRLYLLPIRSRLPLRIGSESVDAQTVARVCVTVEDRQGTRAAGWGESLLSVADSWPGELPHAERREAMIAFCKQLAEKLPGAADAGHPLETGLDLIAGLLPQIREAFNAERDEASAMPWLAALACFAPFDLAMHDAFGQLHQLPTYESYTERWMNRDLSAWLSPAEGSDRCFAGTWPADFLRANRHQIMPAWHRVGHHDPVLPDALTGDEPDDGYPILLADWIRADGLKCLKVVLSGSDSDRDYERFRQVGSLACALGASWLCPDFRGAVTDPRYVNQLLDRLMIEEPALYGMILYLEQPLADNLRRQPVDVHSVSARKPLFLGDAAADWEGVRTGRFLGYSGVALKSCRSQSGSILALCWARAHGMPLMVQDTGNPMLAQIPHLLLAAHAGTIMGVETICMQRYPDASSHEARVHGGLYRRIEGTVDLHSISGAGLGYRLSEIRRQLPEPAVER